ncbi:glycosyltransferase [Nakamurella lactea]|uniref:glycosyltransferase n=1 Tax=Nakamurella lactea TaxID=459515 RepID=UPI000405A2A1|nr:glycosyltransferase [Nakamurella lactea]
MHVFEPTDGDGPSETSGPDPGTQAPGVTIICVFNDVDVRRDCLDRAIDAYTGTAAIEFIPVDNSAHTFSTAGAALNHGARCARNDVVVFAHQDVYLHSLDRIVESASFLSDETWGVLGANGVTSTGSSVGRLRDRVQLIGRSAPAPVDVDSLDEVLFMIRRDQVLQHPLTEDPDLAWHAYAVEYGLRMKSLGLRVGAIDLAITHNSLTVNLDRLDEAHRRVASLHPGVLPVNTTCGTIARTPAPWKSAGPLRKHGWRLRWLRQSGSAAKLRQGLRVPVVLADIRHDVDLLDYSRDAPLHVLNLDTGGGFAEFDQEPIRLARRGRPVIFVTCTSIDDLIDRLNAVSGTESVLAPDLLLNDLDRLSRSGVRNSCIAGVQRGGWWLIAGPVTGRLPDEWLDQRAVPLFQATPQRSERH